MTPVISLRTKGEFKDLDEIRNLGATKDGIPIYLFPGRCGNGCQGGTNRPYDGKPVLPFCPQTGGRQLSLLLTRSIRCWRRLNIATLNIQIRVLG